MKQDPVFSQEFDIQSHHIYQNSEINLSYLLGCLQQAADRHTDSHNLGWNALHEKGCFWAIYRMGIRINRMPRKYDHLTVRTWPNPSQNVLQPRSFEVLDSQNESVVIGQSIWIILDDKEFKTLDVKDVMGAEVSDLLGAKEGHDFNLKIGRVKTDGITPITRDVLYSDIDTNKHVNNTNYVRWLIDSYPAEFLYTHELTELVINYTKQARLGNRYSVYINMEKEEQHLASIVDAVTGEEFCKLKACWKPIEG